MDLVLLTTKVGTNRGSESKQTNADLPHSEHLQKSEQFDTGFTFRGRREWPL